MTKTEQIPIDVVHLLPTLDEKLLELLNSLTPEEWEKPTIAKLWTVKDAAAHLLDTSFRALAMLRDGYYGDKADIQSYQDLVDFLNRLNAEWVGGHETRKPGHVDCVTLS